MLLSRLPQFCHDLFHSVPQLTLISQFSWGAVVRFRGPIGSSLFLFSCSRFLAQHCLLYHPSGIIMGGGSTSMSGIIRVLVVAMIDMKVVDLNWARAKHGLNC